MAAQQPRPYVHVIGQQGINAVAQQRLSNGRLGSSTPLNGVLEASRQFHRR